jgi:hypothetical protein
MSESFGNPTFFRSPRGAIFRSENFLAYSDSELNSLSMGNFVGSTLRLNPRTIYPPFSQYLTPQNQSIREEIEKVSYGAFFFSSRRVDWYIPRLMGLSLKKKSHDFRTFRKPLCLGWFLISPIWPIPEMLVRVVPLSSTKYQSTRLGELISNMYQVYLVFSFIDWFWGVEFWKRQKTGFSGTFSGWVGVCFPENCT